MRQVKILSSGFIGQVIETPALGSKKIKVKVRYHTPNGVVDTWLDESQISTVKTVVVTEPEKKEQGEIPKGKEPWKEKGSDLKAKAKLETKVKVNRGLAGSQETFIG
jgi:hypothetical protein